MRRSYLSCVVAMILLASTAGAALTVHEFATGEWVVEDTITGNYWIRDLQLFTEMTYSEQILVIAGLGTYSNITSGWHMASESEMADLWSYSTIEIDMAFLTPPGIGTPEGGVKYYLGRYDCVPNDYAGTHSAAYLLKSKEGLEKVPVAELGAWVTAPSFIPCVPIDSVSLEGYPLVMQLGDPVYLTGSFTNGCDPLAKLNYGDGFSYKLVSNPEKVCHTYDSPGVYTVMLIVADGGTVLQADIVVAVYDPSGGFVTGGGWIESPPGAYTPENPKDDDLMGRANFGFVSRYKKGASEPTGQTEFVFRAAGLIRPIQMPSSKAQARSTVRVTISSCSGPPTARPIPSGSKSGARKPESRTSFTTTASTKQSVAATLSSTQIRPGHFIDRVFTKGCRCNAGSPLLFHAMTQRHRSIPCGAGTANGIQRCIQEEAQKERAS
jgi:hypothetical protein